MKTTMIALAAVAALTTSVAFAEDFNNTVVSVTAESGALSFKLQGDQLNGYTNLEVRGEVLTYSMGENIDSTLDLFVGHNRVFDEMTVGAEYTVTYAPNAWAVYGSAEVAYTATTSDLSNGDVFVTPTVGTSYVFAEKFTAFGELGYTWNASESWAREGGTAEVGVDYAITPDWFVTPSVVHSFDRQGRDDETQLHIATRFVF